MKRLVAALAGQVGGASSVVALGGGAVESSGVRRALADHMPVWCAVDEEIAWERASGSDRPLAADRTEFSERYARRQPIYESLARAILPSNARDAAGPAAPWLAAMQGTPAVRMAWAESESGSYPAAVGEGAIGLLDDAREALPDALAARTFCVADEEALRHHRGLLPHTEVTIGVRGTESSKTIAEAERILGELSSAGANRDDCVLAFGGGVVGDLAGFCAATYQRGVDLVQAPTTLVAQVDSAYGGKTGVDLPEAKNYVGAYHMPVAVLAVPAGRRALRARVSPTLGQVLPRLLDVAQQPVKLAQGIGGALLLSLSYILCLAACVAAFGRSVPIASIAVVYLTGSAIGSILPTPGGLGGVEAALTAGLTAAGLPGAVAVSAVLLFRLLTFWLPVPFGWAALSFLERHQAL